MTDAVLLETQQQQVPPEGVKPAEGNTTTLEFGKWADQISPELRTELIAGKPKLDDLVKEFGEKHTKLTELEKKLTGVVSKPGKDAKPEEIAAWRTYKEVPEKAEGYALTINEDFKKVPGAEGLANSYKQDFHEAGLSPAEAETAWNKIQNRVVAALKAQGETAVKARESATEELKKAWGKDFEPTMKTLVDFGKVHYGDKTWAKIEAAGLGNDREFLESQLPIAKAYSEGRIIRSGSTSQAEKSPAEKMFPTFKS